MLQKLVVLLPLLGLVNAATYTVTVGIVETDGQPGIGFDPTSIRPAAGDTVTFTFALPEYVKNPTSTEHSATQSSFDSPCSPLAGGFDTGVQSTGSVNAGTGKSFDLEVKDTNPLWFFSSANNDCKSGMVLSVNPPLSGDQTAAAFLDKATASSGAPADSKPPAQSSTSNTPSPLPGTPTNAPASPSPTSPATTGAGSALDGQKGMAFAGVAALVWLIVLA